ncbi:uncharacterized protein LOC120338858 [Styela clava]
MVNIFTSFDPDNNSQNTEDVEDDIVDVWMSLIPNGVPDHYLTRILENYGHIVSITREKDCMGNLTGRRMYKMHLEYEIPGTLQLPQGHRCNQQEFKVWYEGQENDEINNQNQSDITPKCYICKKTGHRAMDCWRRKVCPLCKDWDPTPHSEEDCKEHRKSNIENMTLEEFMIAQTMVQMGQSQLSPSKASKIEENCEDNYHEENEIEKIEQSESSDSKETTTPYPEIINIRTLNTINKEDKNSLEDIPVNQINYQTQIHPEKQLSVIITSGPKPHNSQPFIQQTPELQRKKKALEALEAAHVVTSQSGPELQQKTNLQETSDATHVVTKNDQTTSRRSYILADSQGRQLKHLVSAKVQEGTPGCPIWKLHNILAWHNVDKLMDVLILYVGANNVVSNQPVEKDVDKLVKLAKQKSQKVIVSGIIPRYDHLESDHSRHTVNRQLKKVAEYNGALYIEPPTIFNLQEGGIPIDMYDKDKIRISKKGAQELIRTWERNGGINIMKKKREKRKADDEIPTGIDKVEEENKSTTISNFDEVQAEIETIGPKRRRRKTTKQPILWKFLLDALNQPEKYGKMIHWVDIKTGTFQFTSRHKEELSKDWGIAKNNRCTMTYQKMARALRNYINRGEVLQKVKRKLQYTFLPEFYQSILPMVRQ